MAVNAEATGKTYPPFEYEVGKEKIREYAHAVGEDNPIYFDRAAATEAGFRDIAAPPMFAVIYSWGAVALPAVRPGGRTSTSRCSCTAARSSSGASPCARAT